MGFEKEPEMKTDSEKEINEVRDRKKNPSDRVLFWIPAVLFFAGTLALFFGIFKYRPEIIFPAVEKEKTQLLFLGDSNIDYSFGGTEIPEMVMKEYDSVAYNCAIGGTCAANSRKPYKRTNYYSMFSLYNLSKMIETGDFSVMTRNREFLDSASSNIKDKVLILEHLDYSAMDYVVLHYGMNDYFTGFPLESDERFDEYTYKGALRCGIERMHKACPDAKIILSSITYCRYQEVSSEGIEVGEPISGLSFDFGQGTIDAYRDAMKEVSEEYPYTFFLDNLEGMQLGDSNYAEEGLFQDHMHLGEKGRAIYTEGFLKLIREIER